MINIGVLGCANIATRSIIPAISSMNTTYNLSGVASRDIKKASACADKYSVQAIGSYEELLKNNLEAIYIPLPNALHAEWIEKALEANIHVLVEKSLACNYEQVKFLNQLAGERNLVLMENFQFRFHPQLEKIQSIIKEGTIGELRAMRSSFGIPPFPDKDNIRYKKNLGGGALLDTGAYPIKISQIFLGEELEVKASNLKIDTEKDVDMWGGAYLKQKNGDLFSEIAFGFDNFYQNNIELWGSKGKISTNRIFTAKPDYKPEIILETNKGKNVISIDKANHFTLMLNHFAELIENKQDRQNEYDQNNRQACLLEQVIKQANS